MLSIVKSPSAVRDNASAPFHPAINNNATRTLSARVDRQSSLPRLGDRDRRLNREAPVRGSSNALVSYASRTEVGSLLIERLGLSLLLSVEVGDGEDDADAIRSVVSELA